MATRIRCLKCSKIIECAPYDTSILLQHIKTCHPEIVLPDDETMDLHENVSSPAPKRTSFIDVPTETSRTERQSLSNANHTNNTSGHSTMQYNSQRRSRCSSLHIPQDNSKMEEVTIRHPGQKPMYTRKYNIHSPKVPHSPQKRRMYRTSVEKWRPAKGTIYCPKCGANRKPIIRTRSEKMSYSSLGAACILTCWPLCFLPCIFPAPAKDYLHCAECNNFLGMYDKDNNCIRPNKEFVESTIGIIPGELGKLDRIEQREIYPPEKLTMSDRYDDGRGEGDEDAKNIDDESKISSDRKTV